MSTIKALYKYRRDLEQYFKRIREHGKAGPYNHDRREYEDAPEPKADDYVSTEHLVWASKIRAEVLARHDALLAVKR